MYFKTREDALADGLRIAGLTADPQALIVAAKARGDDVPGVVFNESVTGFGCTGKPAWTFDRSAIAGLKSLVESLRADAPAPKSTRKPKGETNAAR